jgi:hypothetical protein
MNLHPDLLFFLDHHAWYQPPNGWRYPLVGGTGQRHFDGTNFKPKKLLENAQTPTTMAPMLVGDRVHAARCVGRCVVGVYSLAEQGDHAHEFVTAVYRASIWSPAALFCVRVGMNART